MTIPLQSKVVVVTFSKATELIWNLKLIFCCFQLLSLLFSPQTHQLFNSPVKAFNFSFPESRMSTGFIRILHSLVKFFSGNDDQWPNWAQWISMVMVSGYARSTRWTSFSKNASQKSKTENVPSCMGKKHKRLMGLNSQVWNFCEICRAILWAKNFHCLWILYGILDQGWKINWKSHFLLIKGKFAVITVYY